MPRRPDTPCAGGCGSLLWSSATSLPAGERTCRACRAGRPARRCGWCADRIGPYGRRFCSRLCSNRAANDLKMVNGTKRRDPDVRRESYRAKNRRRRARQRGVQSEPYTVREIAERDRWCCQLCHRKVSQQRRYPDPLCPSIDHVLPMALGGDDTRANVQLSHLRCNVAKSTGGSQQLALVG